MSEQVYNHVRQVDLKNDGTLQEIIVMHETPNGDLHFIPVMNLDEIDKERFRDIFRRTRDAHRYPLWEILYREKFKNNGQNALECYFQLVKVRTPSGQILPVNPNRVGYMQARKPAQKPGASKAD